MVSERCALNHCVAKKKAKKQISDSLSLTLSSSSALEAAGSAFRPLKTWYGVESSPYGSVESSSFLRTTETHTVIHPCFHSAENSCSHSPMISYTRTGAWQRRVVKRHQIESLLLPNYPPKKHSSRAKNGEIYGERLRKPSAWLPGACYTC